MKAKVRVKTHTFFNLGTQRALYEKVGGYINKEFYIQEYIKILQAKYKLDRVYRLDLGQNNDGCAVEVEERFKELVEQKDIRQYIKNYPEFICRDLRQKIADLHQIQPDWVLLSAGLEQMISMVAASFLSLNDRILVTSPTFFLFEEYSIRRGAIPIYLHLSEEDGFNWTDDIFYEYRQVLRKLRPKLVWIANPNNPTGASIPGHFIKRIIDAAVNNYAFVIIDEAYGEYVDREDKIYSASSFLHDYRNLIVLRTFSKAYGLANLRVGYAMCSNEDILGALKIHRVNFPITQFSYDLAGIALDNSGYLESVRDRVAKRKEFLITEFDRIPTISYVNTDTNIMMLKHHKFSGRAFINALEKEGVIVAKVPGDNETLKHYIRTTLGTEEEMKYFVDVLKKLKK
ncbi:MAG: aminotransferase class I/II-fold pyridoxal phosphate-dependent enzyme [Candidatus Aminicenantes bacterium]|nr:aminotransferase class I/II-fold pyridoxal phosphate-dependent enzyme [Candidatus Aminicenantes bacterium]